MLLKGIDAMVDLRLRYSEFKLQ